jgi:hypothetical protein
MTKKIMIMIKENGGRAGGMAQVVEHEESGAGGSCYSGSRDQED